MMDASDREIASRLLEEAYPIALSSRSRRLDMRTKFDRNGRVTELMLGDSRTAPGRGLTGAAQGRGRRDHDNVDEQQQQLQPRYWALDGSLIGKLDRLKKLATYNCLSLPVEALSLLPQLEYLEICSGFGPALAESVAGGFAAGDVATSPTPPATILPRLVHLEVCGGAWDAPSMAAWMMWVVTCLPKLEVLQFSFLAPQYYGDSSSTSVGLVDAVVDALVFAAASSGGGGAAAAAALSCGAPSLPRTLRSLHWCRSGMTNPGLQRFLEEVLPRYPNLSTLSIPGNGISSLQFLLLPGRQRGRDSRHCTRLLSTSLSQLNLHYNPVMRIRTRHESERLAFELLLDVLCPFLGSLSPWDDWDAPIEGRLRINRSGGRVLMLARRNGDTGAVVREEGLGTEHEACPPCSSDSPGTMAAVCVPEGLWPVVLERAYATSSKGFGATSRRGGGGSLADRRDATGMYYLVRHCLSSSSTSCSSLSP